MMDIVLLCQYGASTGMLADSIREAARAKGIEASVNAYSISEADQVVSGADIVLLGPQMRFRLNELEKKYAGQGIPFLVINTRDYGMINGEKVLEAALNKIKGEE